MLPIPLRFYQLSPFLFQLGYMNLRGVHYRGATCNHHLREWLDVF
jgi:hypothetical protein